MTMKLKAKRYNLRRPDPVAPAAAAIAMSPPTPRPTPANTIGSPRAPANRPTANKQAPVEDDGFGSAPFPTAKDQIVAMMDASAPQPNRDTAALDLEQIRKEGLTGRQLRLARRMAQKHGLPATSDFDAVRLLRAAGINPFQKGTILELITPEDGQNDPQSTALTVPARGDGVQLPQTIKPIQVPSTQVRAEQSHISDIQKIQRDIARRRRRRSALLMARLAFFVLLPTLLAGWYYYFAATPLYATRTEFVIQQAEAAAPGGLGGLLKGTQFATSQDSIAVQGYLQSRDAMLRLDKDLGFKQHFADAKIDPIQRLEADATTEATYRLYKRNVKIAYDPTEGIIKMEVIAADPELSAKFSEALIRYAEEQVDHLTQRLREDQMSGARESFQEAEATMLSAQRKVVELQEKFKVLSSEVEVSLISAQIGQLETQLSQDRLSLAQMESNARPNQARMDPLIRRIGTLESEIAILRSRLTEGQNGGQSLAQVQSELLVAQADVQTRQLLLAQSLQSMEMARTEANRQVRYLSLSVSPIPPDEATYPRAFENTLVAMLIFAGIYLMISMTAAILREQVSA
jgi:capsular polysaccharide transport system permease protein